jgi:putative signal transducing protein
MADEFVNVLATSSVVEGELARGRLESEGIPVLLKGEGLDAPYPTGPVYVYVPTSFEARARQLLDESN